MIKQKLTIGLFALSLSKCKWIYDIRQAQTKRKRYLIRIGSVERWAGWVFFGLVSVASGAYAQNSITALNVVGIGSMTTIIKAGFAQPLANLPSDFITYTPPRTVLDFPDTTNGLGKSVQDFSERELHSANIVQFKKRTRLVVNLNRMVAYNTKIEDGSLVIALWDNSTEENTVGHTLLFAEAKQNTQESMPHAKDSQEAVIEAREKPLRDADELIKSGKPADAYNLLEPLEFDRSGEIRFDYLIGVAALDSGKPDKATLAFERVLALNPNFAGARLDMARAYFQLGDMPRAKTSFETVLKQNPPEAARATIKKYLDAIAALETVKQTSFNAYIEGTLGHDSNVNNATSQSQISIPLLGNTIFTLNSTNMKNADYYRGIAAGSEVNHNLAHGLAIYAGADVRVRDNFSKTTYSSLSMDGRAGVVLGGGADSLRLGVLGGQYTLANVRNRDSFGMNAEWRHAFSSSDQLIMFGQTVQYRFVDTASKVNDFNQQIIGAGWLHVLADEKSSLFGSLNYGTEKDVAPVSLTNPDGGRADGAKRFSGLRIGVQMPFNERAELFASAGMQAGDYRKVNALFLLQRADRQHDLTLGANWHWDKLWTVRPQLAYSRTNSNIVINSNDRIDASVTIRRDFK